MRKLKFLFFGQLDERRIATVIIAILLQNILIIIATIILIIGLGVMIITAAAPRMALDKLIESDLLNRCYEEPFECRDAGQEKMRKDFSTYPGE